MPTPDDINRDEFYTTSVEQDDDGELELEPPDAEVIAAEERRAKEAVEASMMSVDLDEVYRDSERRHSEEILEKWVRDFKFQFQVKHLLYVTAVTAILLTLWRLEWLGTVLTLSVMGSVAGLYFYLQWQEQKQREAADRRRREMYQRRQEYFSQTHRGSREGGVTVPTDVAVSPATPLPDETDEAWQEADRQQRFRFAFSLKQLLLAMTAAAVILIMVRLLGGAASTASLLGLVALGGLVIHGLGYEPPEILILGWWFILVMYVALSLAAAVWATIA